MSDAKMMIKGRISITVDRQININKHWLSGCYFKKIECCHQQGNCVCIHDLLTRHKTTKPIFSPTVFRTWPTPGLIMFKYFSSKVIS